MRGLAVIGFLFMLARQGTDAPVSFYILLIGLFFGPEALLGQLQINRRSDEYRRKNGDAQGNAPGGGQGRGGAA